MVATVRIILALMLMGMALAAPAAHITDKLLAGFYDQPTAQGQPQRALPSGTPVEILERKGEFMRVRLSDNTEGWIQSKYITDEKPAQVMLLEAQARAGVLEQELAKTKEQLTQSQLELEAAAQQKPPPEAQPAVAQAPEKSASPGSFDLASVLPWSAILAGLLFIAGVVCGFALFNYRFRKRFAGLRL